MKKCFIPWTNDTPKESVLLVAAGRTREWVGECSRKEWHGDCGNVKASCHSLPRLVGGRTSLSGWDIASWEKSLTTSLNVSSPWDPISEDFISSSKRPSRRLKRNHESLLALLSFIQQKKKKFIFYKNCVSLQSYYVRICLSNCNVQWFIIIRIFQMLVSSVL